MLDIKFVRDNPDAVKENIKKKFQDAKLPLVDEVIEKDAKYRECLKEVESLKAARNKLSKANGPLFGQLKKCTDEAKKAELQAQIDADNAAVKADADKMAELEAEEGKLAARIQEIMYTIPQMIDPSVPIGPDDSYNVEAQRFGEPVVPDFPIPYHTAYSRLVFRSSVVMRSSKYVLLSSRPPTTILLFPMSIAKIIEKTPSTNLSNVLYCFYVCS